MKVNEVFGNGQTEAGTLFCRFDRIRSLSKGCKHDRNFLFRNARTGILHADVLTARGSPADLQPNLAGRRGKLDGIRKQIEADLPDRAFVGPQSREPGLEYLVDRDAAAAGTQLQQMMTVLDNGHK